MSLGGYRYRPPRTPEDEEYYDLVFILEKAKQDNDQETIRKVVRCSELFFQKNPEYWHSCFGSEFAKRLANIQVSDMKCQ